jgi:hypothetical protein
MMKRNNRRVLPASAPREVVKPRASRIIRSEKTFALWLWSQRAQYFPPRLYTAVELVQANGLSAVHVARELHRLGAQPVPALGVRKRKGYFHKPMPQLWWLSNKPVPEYLSTVKDAWEEYELQQVPQQVKNSLQGVLAASRKASERCD